MESGKSRECWWLRVNEALHTIDTTLELSYTDTLRLKMY